MKVIGRDIEDLTITAYSDREFIRGDVFTSLVRGWITTIAIESDNLSDSLCKLYDGANGDIEMKYTKDGCESFIQGKVVAIYIKDGKRFADISADYPFDPGDQL